MSLARLRRGEWIVAVGAVGLLLGTFSSWYTLGGVRLTAWDTLEIGRYLMLLTAIVGLILPIAVAAARPAKTSVLAAGRATVVAFACSVYVVYRLINRPDALDADAGLFVGLVSAVLVTIGGAISMRSRIARPASALEPNTGA